MTWPTRFPQPRTLGYEIEVRPFPGWWHHYEGRVVEIIETAADRAVGVVRRCHYLPDRGPSVGGATFVATQPYWRRAHSRARLIEKLKRELHQKLRDAHRPQPEHVELSETMVGWQ